MSEDNKDFLDDFTDEEAAEAVVEQPVQEHVEPADSGRPRGPDGKFIKAEAEAKAEEVETGAKEAIEAQSTEPPSEDDEGQTVPLSVMKALRKELQELKAAQKSQQTQPQSAPDFTGPQVDFEEDPQSYLQGALHQQKMQMSTFMATQEYGDGTVAEAWDAFDKACATDPQASSLSYALLNHPHPIKEVVNWYRTKQELSAVQQAGGLEALKKQWLAEQQAAAQPAQPAAAKPNVPPSLAASGKTSSSEPANEDLDGFDALFS